MPDEIRPEDRVLDRRIPTDFNHVNLYPANALRRIAKTVKTVEVTKLPLPASYRAFYDQGAEGACVGFGESIMCSINNRKKYDARWLYQQAQARDEWPDTPPQEGTSLRAGFDVLREVGHRRWYAGKSRPEEIDEGIVEVNRWTGTVDEDRTAISEDYVIVDGVNWYDGFYTPIEKRVKINGRERVEYWIPEPPQWGRLVGGHCIVRKLASDQRQAFGWLNSWGLSYPWPVWISYESRDRLQREQGESAIAVDRRTALVPGAVQPPKPQ
jgi:hypothetical protein